MSVLIFNAVVITAVGKTYKPGYVLINPPQISIVGADSPPREIAEAQDIQMIDADGAFLLPGMIDAHCHVGLFDDGLSEEGQDGNEVTDPVTPHLQAIDGIFQDDRSFSEACQHGVTSVMTGPGSANVIAGHFSFLKTAGRTVDRMARRPLAAMKAALGENPKKAYGHQSKTPATRMATAAVLRQALQQAGEYRQARIDHSAGSNQDKTKYDARWEALLPVLSGEMILKIHAHRTDDILTAVRTANAFGLRYSLEHCTEGYLIADILAAEYISGKNPDHGCGIPGKGRLEGVITGPLLSDRSKPELSRSEIANPSCLAAAGLPVAIMTDHPVIPIQYLSVSAAVAMRGGLSEEQALAAITITAARLCGMDDQLGSIEPGKNADLVLFSDHPFDFRSQALMVMIDGEIVHAAGRFTEFNKQADANRRR